jgi:hypothetical protein
MRGMRLHCRSKVNLLHIVSSRPMNAMLYPDLSPYPLPGPLKMRGTDLSTNAPIGIITVERAGIISLRLYLDLQ